MPSKSVAEAPAAPKARRPRWSGDWPIPRSVQLPGVRVRVQLVPPEKMTQGRSSYFGYFKYDHERDAATICINAGLPLPVQRYTLLHELQHVMVDLLDVMLENYIEHVHTNDIAAAQPEPAVTDCNPGDCS